VIKSEGWSRGAIKWPGAKRYDVGLVLSDLTATGVKWC